MAEFVSVLYVEVNNFGMGLIAGQGDYIGKHIVTVVLGNCVKACCINKQSSSALAKSSSRSLDG